MLFLCILVSVVYNQCLFEGQVIPSPSLQIALEASDSKIEYENFKILLYNSAGVVRDEAFLDDSGYFLLPSYENGEFTFRVGASGVWFKEDSHVVKVTGNDCNANVEFVVTGFSLEGQVVDVDFRGNTNPTGPGNIDVKLLERDGDVRSIVKTDATGGYVFEEVLPGTYTVKVDVKTLTVDVKGPTKASENIVLQGYSILGEVVNIPQGKSFQVELIPLSPDSSGDRRSTTVIRAPNQVEVATPFSFSEVTSGKYRLEINVDEALYTVRPKSMDMEMQLGEVVLSERFEITAFVIRGIIRDPFQAGAVGVGNVDVFLNAKKRATSEVGTGEFVIGRVSAGKYTMDFAHDKFSFVQKSRLEVSGDDIDVGEVYPHEVSVCGQLEVEDGGARSKLAELRKVAFTSASGDEVESFVEEDGSFCQRLEIDEFQKQPFAVGVVLQAGATFEDYFQETVDLQTAISEKIQFTKIRQRVIVDVEMLLEAEYLKEVEFVLRGKDFVKRIFGKVSCEFVDVVPGDYEVEIKSEFYRFSTPVVQTSVKDKDVEVRFTHVGYFVVVKSEVSAKMRILHNGKGINVEIQPGEKLIEISPPASSESHSWMFVLDSCFEFVQNEFEFNGKDAAKGNTIVLGDPIKYVIRGRLDASTLSSEDVLDVTVLSSLSLDDNPISILEDNRWTHLVGFGEEVSFSASSKLFLVDPVEQTVKVDKKYSCFDEEVVFSVETGTFLEGSVTDGGQSPLPNCEISSPDDPKIVAMTDEQGKFSVGPLLKREYRLQFEKSGYAIEDTTASGEEPIEVMGEKLGVLEVSFSDSSQVNGVEDVILSLSSTGRIKSFRKNVVTDSTGKFVFTDLFPGEYHLKIIMREYEFSHNGKVLDVRAPLSIDLRENRALTMAIDSKKVLFSCSGTIRSLNGKAVSGKEVRAAEKTEVGGEYKLMDSTVTNERGEYKIRGLFPQKKYVVVMDDHEIEIEMVREDIEGIDLVDLKVESSDKDMLSFFGRMIWPRNFSDGVNKKEIMKKKNVVELVKPKGDSMEILSKLSISQGSFFHFNIKHKNGGDDDDAQYFIRINGLSAEYQVYEGTFNIVRLERGFEEKEMIGDEISENFWPILGTACMFIFAFVLRLFN